MKCRNCNRIIEDNSLYCNWCGAEQIKPKDDYYVPEPVKRADYYSGRITVDGKKITVKGKTRKDYYQKVQEIKKGAAPKDYPTLKKAIENYIKANSNTLSPSTLRGYKYIARRFTGYQDTKLDKIDYQSMINDESKNYAPKTVRNSWGLVTPSLEYAKFPVPSINLPALVQPDTQFLDHKQILIFLDAIKEKDVELPALLALHSLRASEIYHLTRDDISKTAIHVRGAMVRGVDSTWIDRDANKNKNSTRDVPIIIPRVLELLPGSGKAVTIPQDTVREHLIKICNANKLPVCSLHDLRRSFASLAAYVGWKMETICAVGGWRPGSPVVHDIYIKVSNTAIKEDVSKMQRYLKMDTSRTPKTQKAP